MVKYYVPLILWIALITVCSSLPPSAYPTISWSLAPKAVHVVFFFCLAFLFHRVLANQVTFALSDRSYLALTLFLTTICGALDEIHQMFTPGRHSRVSDVAIDAASALAFVLFARAMQIYHSRARVPAQ
jgi:VanZ family protein